MSENPHEAPSVPSALPGAPMTIRPRLLLALPLPWLAAFAAWFAWPFTYFEVPLPIAPLGATLVAIYGSVWIVNRLIAPRHQVLRTVISLAYVVAILFACLMALETYSWLGFPEPMP